MAQPNAQQLQMLQAIAKSIQLNGPENTVKMLVQQAKMQPQEAQTMVQQVMLMMQQSQGNPQAARKGAKINYLKTLSKQCPEGTTPTYFKKGGKVCKVCQGKAMKSEKGNSVDLFKKAYSAKCGKKMGSGAKIIKDQKPAGNTNNMRRTALGGTYDSKTGITEYDNGRFYDPSTKRKGSVVKPGVIHRPLGSDVSNKDGFLKYKYDSPNPYELQYITPTGTPVSIDEDGNYYKVWDGSLVRDNSIMGNVKRFFGKQDPKLLYQNDRSAY